MPQIPQTQYSCGFEPWHFYFEKRHTCFCDRHFLFIFGCRPPKKKSQRSIRPDNFPVIVSQALENRMFLFRLMLLLILRWGNSMLLRGACFCAVRSIHLLPCFGVLTISPMPQIDKKMMQIGTKLMATNIVSAISARIIMSNIIIYVNLLAIISCFYITIEGTVTAQRRYCLNDEILSHK